MGSLAAGRARHAPQPTRRSDFERRAFASWRYLKGRLGDGDPFVEQLIQIGVGVVWIVMERDEVLRPAKRCEAQRLQQRAVSPPDVARVLVRVVLTVVNQQIGIGGELRPMSRREERRNECEPSAGSWSGR
jgi:hypothetical protein